MSDLFRVKKKRAASEARGRFRNGRVGKLVCQRIWFGSGNLGLRVPPRASALFDSLDPSRLTLRAAFRQSTAHLPQCLVVYIRVIRGKTPAIATLRFVTFSPF